MEITILQGDITKQKVDAIVNAANNSLLGGGGVDGAIHAAAGFALYQECKTLNGCNTGDAKITKGYNLPAKYIIHTVGPIYREYTKKEAQNLLARCYWRSLEIANAHRLNSIVFPAVSTGAFGYPKNEAVKVVHGVINEFKVHLGSIQEIRFVLFSEESKALYETEFAE